MRAVVDVNQIEARIGAAALNVFCISYYNILALVVGSAADRGLQPEQLGFAASAFLAGVTIVNLGGFLWLRKYNWRWLVAGANLLAAIAFLFPVYVFSYASWLTCNFLAGLATGVTYGISVACLGDTKQRERNLSIAFLGQTFLSAGIIFALPRITSSLDIFSLGHWITASIMLLGIGLIRFIPTHGATRQQTGVSTVREKTPLPAACRPALIMALMVLLLNVIAEGGVWTFLERIAVSGGYDTRFAANVIAASFFAAGTGSLIAAVMGARFGWTKPFLLAVAASILSVLMLWFGSSAFVYMAAVLLFSAAWNLGSPYRMALAISADSSGRYSTLVPGMQALGATLGPAIAGLLIVDGSFAYVYVLSIALWIVTVVLFLAASQRLGQYQRSQLASEVNSIVGSQT